jgi:RNA polymerase sigma-70 factor (ECF subfamily)
MDTDATDFLAHSEWVAELARELVRDAHDAEDLAQSARLAALERPPDARASLRGWFATVLRNLRRSELKTTARRAQREASVARELASEPHDDVFERFETQRMVSAAVAQLDEPYRTAILLRYFEGLAPREIARRTRVPVRTVHTHLARGLGRLRSTLDRRHGGDRSRWFAALAPLAGGAKWNRAWLEILYVKSNVKLAAAAAAIALLIGAGYYGSRPATPRETEIAPLRQPASVERVDPPARAANGSRLAPRSRARRASSHSRFRFPQRPRSRTTTEVACSPWTVRRSRECESSAAASPASATRMRRATPAVGSRSRARTAAASSRASMNAT